jgi:predicted PurR-regulated permease PerM
MPDLNLSDLQQKLSEYFARKGESEAGVILRSLILFLEAGGQLALVMLFGILMVASRDRAGRSFQSLVPQQELLDSVVLLIERFLSVRLGIAFGVACVDWAILTAFGVPYALLAGMFLGVMTLIPVVGFFVGVLPPLAIALAGGISNGRIIGFFCALLLVSSTESHFLTPKLLGRHLNLNLLSAFLGLFIGEKIWGAWGIVLSLPILGILRIILNARLGTRTWGNLIAEKEERDIKNAA